MSKTDFIISLAFSITVFASCNKIDDVDGCISYTKAPVTKVEGPNTGAINNDVNLTVSFGVFNGCGQFGNFEQTSNADTTTINVIAKYQGCICTLDAPIRQSTYKFRVTRSGTYYLKFSQTENTYLTHNITIQ